jgi:hypothetical protein
MSISDKISYLWNKAVEDAMGAGHSDPFAYADSKVAPLRALLHRVEHKQAHPNGLPQRGSRAGRNR